MQTIKIAPGQSILDIALQVAGDVSKAVEIADQNGVSVTDSLVAGTELNVVIISTNPVVRDYQEKKIYPGTLTEASGGIGSMAIGQDFIID